MQPRARGQVLLGVGAVVAVSVIGVGYSVYALATDSPTPARPAASASRTATSSPSPLPATPQAAVPALDAPIFAAPAPWQVQPDAAAGTGRVDLDRAAQIDGHGALSRTGLTSLGFVVGQSRSWRSGGAVLLVLDYTFRDAKGAGGYVSYLRRARDIDPAYRTRAIPGVPSAVGYDRGQGDGLTSSAAFASGRTAYLLVVQGPPPTGPAGELAELARRQYAVATK